MNSLSWFIYLVDVLSSLKFVAMLSCIFVPLAAAVTLGITAMNVNDNHYKEVEREKWQSRLRSVWYYTSRIVVTTFILGIIILIFVPSRNTMYAIAASEMGEKIAKNETVQGITNDATRAVQSWIRKQIEEEKK